MPGDVETTGIRELLEPFHVHYEVSPYYVLFNQHRVGAPPIEQRVQNGFDVNVYGALESEQLPLFHTEGAHTVISYFESAAREIQSKAGHDCKVEILPYTNSLVLDTQQHFRPQGMLQIRISHARGLDQPEGPAEELALKAIRDLLQELGVRGA